MPATQPRINWTNVIALVIITEAVGLAMFAFVVGKADAAVKEAVILCMTNLVSTLVGIAGGLLTGYQVGKASALDSLPLGSKEKTEVQTPPIIE